MTSCATPVEHLDRRWRLMWARLTPHASSPSLPSCLGQPAASTTVIYGGERLLGHLEALEILEHHCLYPHEVACALFVDAWVSQLCRSGKASGAVGAWLRGLGADGQTIDRIVRIAACLRGDSAVDSIDAAVASDAKYWILGAPEGLYDRYAAEVRTALRHVTDVAYCLRRLARLRSYGRRGNIYRCPELIWEHELRAHENIAREMDGLRRMQASYRALADIAEGV